MLKEVTVTRTRAQAEGRTYYRTGRTASTLEVTTSAGKALDWLLKWNRKVEVLNELGQVLEVWG